MRLPRTTSIQPTAITALFLKTYFFKLASDVSGEELLLSDLYSEDVGLFDDIGVVGQFARCGIKNNLI